MVDRSQRYKDSPKGTEAAKKIAEKTAGGKDAPHADNPDKAGKVGEDPGPSAGRDSTWGVVADRHKREHADMTKRHSDEHVSVSERHTKEARDMMARHHKEMADHMESAAAGKVDATAGSPKELGTAKSEGKAGAEV